MTFTLLKIDKESTLKILKLINKKINYTKAPSNQNMHEDYDDFVPKEFKNKILLDDSSDDHYKFIHDPLDEEEKKVVSYFFICASHFIIYGSHLFIDDIAILPTCKISLYLCEDQFKR